MIVDSTALVDLVNGKPEAKDFLLAHETLATSRVNVMELLFGSRSKKELRSFLKQFSALIAATALVRGEELATHNLKHFKPIKGLSLTVPY